MGYVRLWREGSGIALRPGWCATRFFWPLSASLCGGRALVGLPPGRENPSDPSLSLISVSHVLLFRYLRPNERGTRTFLRLYFMGELQLCQDSVAFIRFCLLLRGVRQFTVGASGGKQGRLPAFGTSAPPIRCANEDQVATYHTQSFQVRVPGDRIVRIVKGLIMVASLAELRRSAHAVVGRHDAQLHNVELGTNVRSPVCPPGSDARAQF